MAIDAILLLYLKILSWLVVNKSVIENKLSDALPFMVAETMLMQSTKSGGDRQDLHEKCRIVSQKAYSRIKNDGQIYILFQLLAADLAWGITAVELNN
jgi:adenylosuccinate lyase